MSEEKFNYSEIGLKAGLEIHQQLDTTKLFCNCPSVLRKDEPDFIVKRKLHAVAGESGEIDIAARHESERDKSFVYQGYDTTCLVELDEEPPHEINQEALKIALQIALLMNMKIMPITQIMRKTVIDGSNTSGFQRTVLIAQDGYVETSEGRVGITSLLLEEDAARIVGYEKKIKTYRLDRLGIPMVEVVTAPDIKTPEQAKEVALHIGEILRSCKVRRGIGTIRQDVNVSIRNENRVEIKGMQDMKIFVKAIENEVLRQKKLSDKKKPVDMEVRDVLPDASTKYQRPLPGSARMYPETDLPLLKISRDFINETKKSLPKLRGESEEELKKKGLPEDMIKLLFKQNKLEEFKELVKIYDNPKLISKLILILPKEISTRMKKPLEEIEEKLGDYFIDIINSTKKENFSEADIKIIMERIVEGMSFKEAVKLDKKDIGDVEDFILKLIKDKPGLSEKAYMGLVMKEFKGNIDGKKAMEIIEKYLK